VYLASFGAHHQLGWPWSFKALSTLTVGIGRTDFFCILVWDFLAFFIPFTLPNQQLIVYFVIYSITDLVKVI